MMDLVAVLAVVGLVARMCSGWRWRRVRQVPVGGTVPPSADRPPAGDAPA